MSSIARLRAALPVAATVAALALAAAPAHAQAARETNASGRASAPAAVAATSATDASNWLGAYYLAVYGPAGSSSGEIIVERSEPGRLTGTISLGSTPTVLDAQLDGATLRATLRTSHGPAQLELKRNEAGVLTGTLRVAQETLRVDASPAR